MVGSRRRAAYRRTRGADTGAMQPGPSCPAVWALGSDREGIAPRPRPPRRGRPGHQRGRRVGHRAPHRPPGPPGGTSRPPGKRPEPRARPPGCRRGRPGRQPKTVVPYAGIPEGRGPARGTRVWCVLLPPGVGRGPTGPRPQRGAVPGTPLRILHGLQQWHGTTLRYETRRGNHGPRVAADAGEGRGGRRSTGPRPQPGPPSASPPTPGQGRAAAKVPHVVP